MLNLKTAIKKRGFVRERSVEACVKTKSSPKAPHKTGHKMHPPFGGASLELRQTVKAVTPFGGLAIFAQFLERVGWSQVVSAHMPVHYSSPNAIDPSQTLTAFMISVIAGAKRFAHGSFLRADRALQAIFGLSRFPGDDAVRSFFGRFDAGK